MSSSDREKAENSVVDEECAALVPLNESDVSSLSTEYSNYPISAKQACAKRLLHMFNIVANLKETCIRESVPGKIRFEALDGTRAIALLWVLLFHSWNYIIAILDTPGTLLLDKLSWARDRPWATLIIRTGDMGVDIFFVLSGFLIGFVLLNEYQKTGSFNFGKFYLKRFLRLWPVLFISTVFVLVVGWTAKGELSRFAWCFPYAWRHLIFVSSLLPIPGGEIGGVVGVCFGHFWSTSTEAQFYLVVPLLVVTFTKWRRIGMILLGVAVVGPILYRLVLATTFYPLTNWHNINAFENLTYYYFFSRIPSFGCGLISSLWLYKRGILFGKRRHSEADEYDGAAEIASPLCPPLIRRIGHVLAILLISFALIASQHFPPVLQMIEPMAAIPYPQVILTLAMVLRRLCFGMGSAWLIAQCVAGNAFVLQWFLSMRVWYPIASISYTAYCVHTTVLIILHEVVWIQPWEWWNLQNGSFFLQYAVNVVIVIAVSLPVHIFIERPFMKAVR